MSAQCVNRKDERYYLLQGTTKTGKPKYYCSRKLSGAGTPVERMPEGFEWREHPETGIVSVRKTRPTRIAPSEREMLVKGIREQAGLKAFIVDVTEDSLVVYLCDRNPDAVARVMGSMFGMGGEHVESMTDWTAKHAHYSPMMQFVLVDADKRLFLTQRWCFRGSIDDWIPLSGRAPLPELIEKYVPHLGQESFYELD